MSQVTISEEEMRGLSEDGDEPIPHMALFEPADFADSSRAGHRLFGKAIADVSTRLGAETAPLPPEIRMTTREMAITAAGANSNWSSVLQFTGQFRATALFTITGSSPKIGETSSETISVLLQALARDAEVAFRREYGRAVAITVEPFEVQDAELPFSLSNGSPPAALIFEMEIQAGEKASLEIYGDSVFIKDLAAMERPVATHEETQIRQDPDLAEPALSAPVRSPDGPLRFSAEIGNLEMTETEFSSLAAGQVVRLDRRAGDLAVLAASGRQFASGEVVVCDGYLALKIVAVSAGDGPAELDRDPAPDRPDLG